MALDDWKKEKKNIWSKLNSNTWELTTVQIYTTAGFHDFKKNLHLKGWIVEISGSDITSIHKQFNSIEKALAYAKKYMRSH